MADDKRALVEALIEQMQSSGRDLDAPGIDADEMVDVLKHPKAVDTIYEMMMQEQSSVQHGESAPDFCLRPLGDYEKGAPVRLSDHFGKRPVALVFGSYT